MTPESGLTNFRASGVGAADRPHRITLASVTELPFGREHRLGRDWNSAIDAVLGGWQFSAKYEWQTGQPLAFNNNTYFDPACGDPSDLKSRWGKDASGGVQIGARIAF